MLEPKKAASMDSALFRSRAVRTITGCQIVSLVARKLATVRSNRSRQVMLHWHAHLGRVRAGFREDSLHLGGQREKPAQKTTEGEERQQNEPHVPAHWPVEASEAQPMNALPLHWMIQRSEGGEPHHWLKGVWLKGAGASGSKGCGSRVLVLMDVPNVFAGVREFGVRASMPMSSSVQSTSIAPAHTQAAAVMCDWLVG